MMMKLVILLVVGVIARQTYGDAPEAIVGGFIATAGQFPYQVSLVIKDIKNNINEHNCGGTIISSTHIVTAAHCIDEDYFEKHTVVVTGTLKWNEGEVHEIKCIRLHPDYTGKKKDSWKHDIAVLTLKKPIIFNKFQRPIPLATQNYATGDRRGITSGWGKTSVNSNSSPVMKWLGVNVLSEQDCLQRPGYPSTLKTQICTLEKVGHGACSGDSGGPLVINGELCGITSWVTYCARGVSDVFTSIYYYLDFIKECQKMC